MDPLSITVATIAIIQSISSTYNVIRHLKGLPKAFNEVGQDLPLVKETLDLTCGQLESSTLDESTKKAIEPIIKSCREKASALQDIFQEIDKKKKHDKEAKDWSALVGFYRILLLRLGKAHRVETLMQGILKGLKGLAVHQLFKLSTKAQIDKLESAINKLLDVEPSLPDSEFESNGSNATQQIGDGGKGWQFNAMGGTQTNKLGQEFNATGNMNFVSHYHQSIPIDSNPESMILQWLLFISPPLPFENKQHEMFQVAKRAPRAGKWFLELPQFTDWRDGESRKLWCHGIAGAGKTVLVSIIVNHLQTSYSLNKNIACIYIYFDYKKHNSQNLTGLLSSLLVQLLRSQMGISTKIREIFEAWKQTRIQPSPEDYVEMLKSQIKAVPKVFIVIDALDECLDDTETNTLSSFLGACQELPENAHMLFTSRPGIDFAPMIDATCELAVTADASDIRQYLDKSINSRHRLRDIIEAELKNDSLFRDKAINTIVARSQGMFLLAHLHMEVLASCYTIDSFKNSLANLSKTPDDVYEAALERIGMQGKQFHNLANSALTWLVFAKRELTIDELAHAIDIYDNMTTIQAGRAALPIGSVAPSTEFALTSACAGIVVIDKKSKIVRLAHNTAEEYLRKNHSTFSENAQSKIADTCLSCLSYLPLKQFSKDPPPQDELNDHCKKYPFLRYAADHWGDHLSLGVKGGVYQFAWEFLSENRKLNNALQVMANFQFRHQKDISSLHIAAYFGLAKLMKKAMGNNKRLMINAQTRRGETPLHWAATHRQRAFLEFLVDQNADLNVADIEGKTALHQAIYNGDDASVEVLLSSRRVDLRLEDSQRWTPLRCAAAYGQFKTVEMLLNAGAEPDAQDKDKWTALRWAAQRGHMRIVELLINYKASLETPDSDEWTLLRWAATEGLEEFIMLLIKKRVNLDVTDMNGCTALQWAVNYGHAMTAWLLIRAHADINKPDIRGMTPLHAAVEICQPSSNSSILCLLLENEAKIDAQTKLGQTPLHIAASRGSDSAVWLLLEKGADPSQKDANNRTALHWAITLGHMKVAQLLIWKAEHLIHAVDHEKRTALHYAASVGHLPFINMLLNHRADINVCDIEGNTPLHLAVSQQQEDIVACLVGRGADVNIRTKKRKKWTAIRLAVSMGNTTIIETLCQVGEGNQIVERNVTPIPREVEQGKVNRGGRYSARVEDE